MMNEQSDAQLVKRCLSGESSAYSVLITRHQTRLKHVVVAILYNSFEAEDVVQEAILQAYLNLKKLRSPERFRAWLCGIGINLAKMWLREQRQRPLSSPFSFHDPSPEELLTRQETISRVRTAIADLSTAEREAILLVYLEGFSHQEAAALLEVSLSAVKVRVHRGRNQLRATLTSEFAGSSKSTAKEKAMIAVTIHDVLASVPQALPQIDKNQIFHTVLEAVPAENREALLDQLSITVNASHSFGPYVCQIGQDWGETVMRELALLGYPPHHVILLKEMSGEKVVPIWIGPHEAESIVIKLTGKTFKRPLSFDLMTTLLEHGGITIERATISRLHEEIFYATLTVRHEGTGKSSEIDCRPSDALGLAVRMDLPLFIAPEVLSQTGVLPDEEGHYPVGERAAVQYTWQSLLTS